MQLDPSAAVAGQAPALPDDPSRLLQWQQSLRQQLTSLCGLEQMAPMQVPPKAVESTAETLPSHTRTRLEITTEAGYTVPCFLLKPRHLPLRPAIIIAFHGHGLGKSEVAGIAADAAARERIERLNYAYGLTAVEQGYMTVVPDMRGFGERVIGDDSCRRLNASAINAGVSLKGLHTWDAMRIIDYLQTRPDCAHSRIGTIGLSGGGGSALWLAALDTRVAFAVVAAHLKQYDIAKMGCSCNLVPGLEGLGGRAQLAGLIMPRPLFVQSGTRDGGCPRHLVEAALAVPHWIASILGTPPPEVEFHDAGHRWSDARVWDWLAMVSSDNDHMVDKHGGWTEPDGSL